MKRLKNVEGKNEKQLKAIKDQGQKQLKHLLAKQIKKLTLKYISFKGKLNFESKKSIMTLRKKLKRLIKQNLSTLAQVSIIINLLSLWV